MGVHGRQSSNARYWPKRQVGGVVAGGFAATKRAADSFQTRNQRWPSTNGNRRLGDVGQLAEIGRPESSACTQRALDRMLIVNQRHLDAVLRECCSLYNLERPHRSRNLRLSCPRDVATVPGC